MVLRPLRGLERGSRAETAHFSYAGIPDTHATSPQPEIKCGSWPGPVLPRSQCCLHRGTQQHTNVPASHALQQARQECGLKDYINVIMTFLEIWLEPQSLWVEPIARGAQIWHTHRVWRPWSFAKAEIKVFSEEYSSSHPAPPRVWWISQQILATHTQSKNTVLEGLAGNQKTCQCDPSSIKL